MKADCTDCKRITNHESLFIHKNSYDTGDVWGSDAWEVIRCLGCECVSFRHTSVFSEDLDHEGNLEEHERLYPIRGKYTLVPKIYYALDYQVRQIYIETINSFNIQAWILCAVGIRAILEGICKVEGIKSGKVTTEKGMVKTSRMLDGKIAGLEEKGLLTLKHAMSLHTLRFLGNAAVHELSMPTIQELALAIEIIEHTIENLYELEGKVRILKSASRRRTKD